MYRSCSAIKGVCPDNIRMNSLAGIGDNNLRVRNASALALVSDVDERNSNSTTPNVHARFIF